MKRNLAKGFALTLLLGTVGWLVWTISLALPRPGKGMDAIEPTTGAAVLNTFRCRYAETKRVVVRGVEDGFSPDGLEPSKLHPRLALVAREAFALGPAPYDQTRGDGYVADYFEPPANTVDGIFVIGLKRIGEADNDTFQMGDLLNGLSGSGVSPPTPETQRQLFVQLRLLATLTGWNRTGDIYWARFEDIPFRAFEGAIIGRPRYRQSSVHQNLLDYIRAGGDRRVVDVYVQDDTAVDFMAMAWCEAPDSHQGLTLAFLPATAVPFRDVVLFKDAGDAIPGARSNPYKGDIDCAQSLPLLCLRDRRAPVPRRLVSPANTENLDENLARHWSGGDLRLTRPVRGDAFETIGQADAFCRTAFGSGWRVADFHSGSSSLGISGYGDRPRAVTRAWVDIKDQPYGVCWARQAR